MTGNDKGPAHGQELGLCLIGDEGLFQFSQKGIDVTLIWVYFYIISVSGFGKVRIFFSVNFLAIAGR